MDFWQIIMTPFSFLLKLFCEVFDSYGIALIIFSAIVTVILFPMNLKGKRSMIKMNLISGELQAIKARCGNNTEKYNREVQEFYAKNDVSPFSGCGWSFVPLLILMPLYAIIRRPFKYLMGLTDAATQAVAAALGMTDFVIGGNDELILASLLNESNLAAASAAAQSDNLFIINFDFFGLDLAATPVWRIWETDLSWAAIGLFLLPIISAVLSLLSTQLTTKLSQQTRTENPDPAVANSNRTMMITMPILSAVIGFSMPAGMCVYWIANSVLRTGQELIMHGMLKGDYEKAKEEKAEQEKRLKEEEKERRRAAAERKAAAIAAGKKKKQPTARDKGVIVTASRVDDREFARGRAYSPTRYPTFPYFDPDSLSGGRKAAEEENTETLEEIAEEPSAPEMTAEDAADETDKV